MTVVSPIPRHILIPVHDFMDGGTENIAFRLARLWQDMGARVSVVAGVADGPMRSRLPEGVTLRVLTPEMPRSLFSRLYLARAMAPAIRELAPDAIFIPGNWHLPLAHGLRRAFPQTAIIGKISNPLLPPGVPDWALRRWLVRRYLAPCDALVAMSAGLARDCPLPVAVIADPNIADDAPILPSRRAERSGPLHVMAIGRLWPQKDMGLAIRTLAELRRTMNARLTILGEGEERPRLERLAAQLGLGDQVAMPGFVGDVEQRLREADVLLVTSRYEGGPATAVEALAASVPVVSTDCSHFLRQLGLGGRTGQIVPSRAPRDLAGALVAQAREKSPTSAEIASAIDQTRYGASARAWLDLIDTVVRKKEEVG